MVERKASPFRSKNQLIQFALNYHINLIYFTLSISSAFIGFCYANSNRISPKKKLPEKYR